MKTNNKQKRIIAIALATWGFILIGSGLGFSMSQKPKKINTNKVKVINKRVSNLKSNEIKLKDMSSEINQPISVNIKDYLENYNDIDEKILRQLKLDTSTIKIEEAGSYTYTITYKKKKFSASYVIKEKELPKINMTLKNLNLEVGTSLETDPQKYVVETLSDEVKNNTVIDLSKVNTTQSGSYQYTITYNNRLYMGTITIYEPNVAKPETPKTEPKKETQTENKEEKTS